MFRKRKRDHEQPAGGDKASVGEVLQCSFCRKTQEDVHKLIAGPTGFICDECVEVCVDIIVDDSTRHAVPEDSAVGQHWRSVAERLRPSKSVTCSLCGNLALEHEMLRIENRGMICGRCADAVEDALARGRPID